MKKRHEGSSWHATRLTWGHGEGGKLSLRVKIASVSLNAPLAQLDRASDYESEGREFESLRARHKINRRNPHFARLKLPKDAKIDHVPWLLQLLVDGLDKNPVNDKRELESARAHGNTRREQGYSVPMMVEETLILYRLVADTLEREWNEKLRALAETREERERARQQDHVVLDEAVRQRLVAMTTDFRKLWDDADTANRERKRLLAYILEDNDDAGRAHSNKIQAALSGIVPVVAVVSFPELAEKADVSDWLEAGGNKKLLLARAEQARKKGEKHRAYIATDLIAVQPRAIRWLWPKHLARGVLELLTGLPATGKSQIHCQYVACATTGRAWPDGRPALFPVGRSC